jgi:hypothetical protein
MIFCGVHRVLLVLIILSSSAYAAGKLPATATGDPAGSSPDCTKPENKALAECKAGADNNEYMYGLHFGLGVSASQGLGGVGDVKKDTNGIVRVVRQNNGAARGLFELHYFMHTPFPFLQPQHKPGEYGPEPANQLIMAWGPYVSLNTSPFGADNGKVFDAVGAGWMLGFKIPGVEKHSLNIGAGVLLDSNVRKLTPGVLPDHTTAVDPAFLTHSETSIGWQVLISYKLFDFNLK